MMEMTKFLKVLKVVVVNSLIFSLLQNPFISDAMAAPKGSSSSGIEADDILKIANGAVNLYQNYLGQKYQIIQQQIASANNQRIMSQLSPSCRKADGTACYVTQAKFFPECQMPASMSNMPQNVCSANSTDPNAISSMITYESVAKSWENYYEQMRNEASNAAYPVGLRCLKDKQKAIDSQLTEMMNSLQRLQDKLNQDKQVFRDNNKKLLEEMNTANEELFGGSKNLKSKTTDFSKYFSQSCQAVIGKDTLRNGTQVGLNGILQNLSGVNKSAADFVLNKGSIENDIRRETDKISATIKAGGVDDFLQKGYIPQSDEAASTFSAIGSQIKKQNAEFDAARARIAKTLKEVDYPMPTLSSNFSADMEDFMAGANDYFKKRYINDCVTGADKGIAIPVEDILRSLEQRATNSEGTARNDYRIALKRILDSDAMIADKMAQIKALEADYPGMTVTYKDSTQNRVTESPYSLFMKTIDKCEQRYTQDDTFANKSNRSVSYQKKVERARAALAELKTLNDSYASKVSAAVLSQVLDCGGTALKSGSCSEDTLNSKGENFCISHANQCANEIQGCYAEANTQVQTRKTKMENLAKKFNQNVTDMIARSNSLYEQQKAAVTNMTKLIQARFPGTNFEIPKDMFVSMPELKKDAYGVEMAGDGKMESFLDGPNSMPEKITLLKEMFKRQKSTVDDAIVSYIGDQEKAMGEQISRWKSLASECKSAIDGASKALAAANAEGQKKQAEEDGRTGEFCSRFYGLSESPLGACDDAKDLATDMKKIASRLDPSVAGNVNSFRAICNQYNNESENGTEDSSRKNKRAAGKTANLKSLCVSSDGTSLKSDDDFIAAIKKSSPALRKSFGENSVSSFITGSGSTSSIQDEDARDLIEKLKSEYNSGKDISKDDLKKQFKNDEAAGKVSYGDGICGALMKTQIKTADNGSKFENFNDAATAPTTFSKGDNSINLIKDLVASGAGNFDEKASDLGQKISGAPCDMQNKSNASKSTTMPWMTDPSSLDRAILGRNQ